MIAFFADNHFKARPGFHLNQQLPEELDIAFHEDDLSPLPGLLARDDCALLILNWISDTSGNAHPGGEIERPLRAYLEAGRPLLLLHGASAAFPRWAWWREIVGLRWVRPGDPDGFSPSTHPVRPYAVTVSKTRHPLAAQLVPFSLPEDEIYIELEQTAAVSVLLETRIDEGTFPQAYLARTRHGGLLAGFIPGHAPAAFNVPELVADVRTLIRHLLDSPR
jgi:hypothetical protein